MSNPIQIIINPSISVIPLAGGDRPKPPSTELGQHGVARTRAPSSPKPRQQHRPNTSCEPTAENRNLRLD